MGYLADNFGRKPTILLCITSQIIGYVIILTAKSLNGAAIGLLVIGVGNDANYNISIVVISENL